MTPTERRSTSALALIVGLRMLGLFLILPVFSLYGTDLAHATPILIGLAIGVYGLTQAVLQVPMGMASDRVGRRPVIVAGLLVFAAGSVLAAVSDSIYGVIAGRALQGAGAVSAAVIALVSDLTRESQRTKAMAMVGITVGAAFLVALMAGPLLAGWVGLSGVFWATALLALAAVALLFTVVPAPPEGLGRGQAQRLAPVLRDPDLLRLDFGIFALHLGITATFVALPQVLEQTLGVDRADHWQVYVPVLLASVVAMVPVIAVGERRRVMHRVLGFVVAALAVSHLLLAGAGDAAAVLLVGMWLYFAAFNILEASLPSLISRFASPALRGAALGVYSTSQFLGAFLGGVLGGALYGSYGAHGVFLFCGAVAGAWFLMTLGLRAPQPHQDPAAASASDTG